MRSVESIRHLEGAVLDGRVRIGERVTTLVHRADGMAGSGLPTNLFVRFFPDHDPAEPLTERFLEATYLDHPNLLRCFGAGVHEVAGERITYALLEPYDETLTTQLERGPYSESDALDLGTQLGGALSYLHKNNLVCCGLDAPGIVIAGGRPKIAEYSQMRVPGTSYAAETRRLLASSPAVPPEAFEGIVTPAWDSWSLSSVLMSALSGPRPEPAAGRRSPRREFPEPFATVIAECMTSDWRSRCDVGRIVDLLKKSASRSDELSPDPSPLRPAQGRIPSPPSSAERVPLETHFRVEPPRRSSRWFYIAAMVGAVALGAFVAAITLNQKGSDPATAAQPPVTATGEIATPAKPGPSVPEPVQEQEAGTAERERSNGDAAAIRTVLNDWVAATRSRNAAAMATYYAPTVDTYYGVRGVSREFVRHQREEALSKVHEIRRLDIGNVQVSVSEPARATVTLDKTWDFGAGSSGKVRQELVMRKYDSQWRIASERDIRVYRLHTHGRGRA